MTRTCLCCERDSESILRRYLVNLMSFFRTHLVKEDRRLQEQQLINLFRSRMGKPPVEFPGRAITLCEECLAAVRHHIRDGFRCLEKTDPARGTKEHDRP